MNKVLRFASMLLLALIIFKSDCVFAIQDPPTPDPPTCPDGSPPPCGPQPGLPIDDHAILLLIIGLVYGSYKLVRILKKRQDLKS